MFSKHSFIISIVKLHKLLCKQTPWYTFRKYVCCGVEIVSHWVHKYFFLLVLIRTDFLPQNDLSQSSSGPQWAILQVLICNLKKEKIFVCFVFLITCYVCPREHSVVFCISWKSCTGIWCMQSSSHPPELHHSETSHLVWTESSKSVKVDIFRANGSNYII